jgi:hypothetical protein
MLSSMARAEPTSTEARARALSDEGLAHFRQHEYDPAIAAFRASYALSPQVVLLFDIAQAYRLGGDCDNALQFYRRYAAAATAVPNRAALDGRIHEMEQCARANLPPPIVAPPSVVTPPPVAAPPASAAPPIAAPPVTTSPPPSRGQTARRARRQQLGGIITFATGAAILGVAVYFSVDGANAQSSLQRELTLDSRWLALEQTTDARGRRDNLTADVLYGVGAAAIAGGALLFGLGRRLEHVPRVAAFVRPGEAVVSCAVSF